MFSFVLVAALLCSAAVDATLCVGDSQCGCLCVADLCTASNASPSSFACTAMGAAAAAANCTTACNESLYRTKPYAVVWIRPSASGTAVENIASKRSVSFTAYGGHKAIIDRTDSSLTFDGNWHVSTPLKENNVNLGDDFALMFWLKTTMVGVARSSKAGEPTNVWYQFPYIVHADASGEANDFGVTLNGGKVMFGVRTPQWNVLSSTTVNDGLWHHVAIRFAAKQMQLFVDGKLQGAVTTAVVGPLSSAPAAIFGRGVLVDDRSLNGSLSQIVFFVSQAVDARTIAALAAQPRLTMSLQLGFCSASAPTQLCELSNATAAPTTVAPTSTVAGADEIGCPPLFFGTEVKRAGGVECSISGVKFRIDCGSKSAPAATLPSAADKFVLVTTVGFGVTRCPAFGLKLDIEYELFLSSTTVATLRNAKIDVPSGVQVFTHTTTLEGRDVEIPIWPSSGIAEISLPLQSKPNRFGLAAVVKDLRFVGASLTTSYVLRVCNGKPDCIDIAMAPDTTFGDRRICCVPKPLLCAPAEVQMCAAQRVEALRTMGKSVDPDLLAESGLQPLPGESTIRVSSSAPLVTATLLHLALAVCV